jgi:Ca2+-dependent lipid-binding protein
MDDERRRSRTQVGAGVKLTVRVVSAKGLRAADRGGVSDPFCQVWVLPRREWPEDVEPAEKDLKDPADEPEPLFVTPVVKKTVDPEFPEEKSTATGVGATPASIIHVRVFDKDPVSVSRLFVSCASPLRVFCFVSLGAFDVDTRPGPG